MRAFSIWCIMMLAVICTGTADQLGIRIVAALITGLALANLIEEL